MAMKGMEMGLKVLFAVVAVLIVVIVLLGIFTGGAGQLSETLQSWWGGVPAKPAPCSDYTVKVDCNKWLTCHWCEGLGCKSVSEACPTK